MSETRASTSILVLHDPTLDPYPFIRRLTSDTSLRSEIDASWAIDNKYYTAVVKFDVEPISEHARSSSDTGSGLKEGVPVVLYLFSHQPPEPLPPFLTQVITSEPRDVTIAIRVKPDPSPAATRQGQTEVSEVEDEADVNAGPSSRADVEWEEVEEVFLELGMEVMDECRIDKEEDMLLDPLEEIRITIQTHMWPNMVRRPLATRSAVELDLGDDDDELAEGSGESEYEAEPPQTTFPVGFARPGEPGTTTNRVLDGDQEDDDDDDALWSKEWEGISTADRQAAQAQFPSLEALNQQLAETTRLFAQLKVERDAAEQRRMERLDRLERALDEDSDADEDEDSGGVGMRFEEEDGLDIGPEEAEWTRLDDWLDGDEGYEALDDGDEEAGDDEVSLQQESDAGLGIPDQIQSSLRVSIPTDSHPTTSALPDQKFEDDFADFHSAPPQPPPGSRLRMNKNGIPAELPVDPTPLLLHLQSVRAELAGVPDEDERRVRAAREVMAVLGLDMADMGMDMDLELEEGEMWAAGPAPRES